MISLRKWACFISSKFAQILAMQNVGNLFTEADRQELSQVCDSCTGRTQDDALGCLKAGVQLLPNFLTTTIHQGTDEGLRQQLSDFT